MDWLIIAVISLQIIRNGATMLQHRSDNIEKIRLVNLFTIRYKTFNYMNEIIICYKKFDRRVKKV